METEALKHLRYQASGGLYPSITKRIGEDGEEYETDFYTEALCFHSALHAVFYELENNSINYSAEVAGKYVGYATKYLTEIRDRLRNFFPEDKEYQTQVRQIEAENIIDEPYLEYTPDDSISETKLEYPVKEITLYANRICQWGLLLLQRYTTEQGAAIELEALDTIYEKLLLLKYSGVYEQIYNICEKNKSRTAVLIAAITGEKPGSIRTISANFDTPHIRNNSSPFTRPAVDNIITLLIKLRLDPSELIKISEKMLQKKT